jgi:hypothetical protein
MIFLNQRRPARRQVDLSQCQDLQMTKPIDALKTIARYIEAKKPKTLAEAEHMLDLISVMADETIRDEGAAESSLAKRLISEPFFP